MVCSYQRIILLPGFGEDAKIFRKITPYLRGYQLVNVDYRDVLGNFSVDNINLNDFIDTLIQHLDIKEEDILIGHSLGGYFSHQIRQKVNCQNCLIASFTDPKKIKLPVNFKRLIKWLTMNGLFSSKILQDGLWNVYRYKASHKEIENAIDVLQNYGKRNIFKLLKIIEPRKNRIVRWLRGEKQVDPSLILHAAHDWIVKRPDEQHIKIPGDHFAPATYNHIVGKHLEDWLYSIENENALLQEIEIEAKLYAEPHLWSMAS